MAATPLKAQEAHGGGHHIHPYRMYAWNAIGLSFLMLLTIWASGIHFPGGVVVNNLIAVGIATLKLILVVQFFMHVKYSTSLTKLFAYLGFIWMFLLGVILADYFFRHYEPVASWTGRTESALPRQIGSTDNAPLAPIEQNVQNRIPKGLGN